MKTRLFWITLLICSLNVKSQSPNFAWAHAADGSGFNSGSSMATDSQGNVYVTGCFISSTISFGSYNLTNNSVGNSNADMFLVKYDLSGNVLWAKSAGSTSDDRGQSIAIDASDNVLVSGFFGSYSITIGGIPLNSVDSSYDFFVAKYDSNGNAIWAKSFGGWAKSSGITTDLSGSVFVTGSIQYPSVTIGTFTLTGLAEDPFIVKYDSNGNVVWAKRAVGGNADRSNAIVLDNIGNIYITGSFSSSTLNFGNITINNTSISPPTSNIFIAKYDVFGNSVWAKSVQGHDEDRGNSIVISSNNNLYVAGQFRSSSINLGGNFLSNNFFGGGSSDLFLTKLDTAGNFSWAKSNGGNGEDMAESISVDASENIYLTGGFFSKNISMGSTTLINADTSSFTPDILIAKYDPSGNVSWSKRIGGDSWDEGTYIIVNNTDAYVTGCFASPSIAFGSVILNNSFSGWDVFVGKLGNINEIRNSVSNKRVSLYPNPVSGTLNIELDENSNTYSVAINDVLGNTVYETSGSSIDVSNFPNGIYFATITSGKESGTRKFVVSK